jgi:hypothetical protein
VAGATRTLTLPVAHEVCQYAPYPVLPEPDFGPHPRFYYADCPWEVALNGAPLVGPPSSTVWFIGGDTCLDNSPRFGPYDLTKLDCSTLSGRGYTGAVAFENAGCYPVTSLPWDQVCSALQHGQCVDVGMSRSACAKNPFDDGGDVALLPGDYTFTTGTIVDPGSDTRTLAEGALATLTFQVPILNGVPDMFQTELELADPRELPDSDRTFIKSYCGNDYYLPATARGTLTLRAYHACGYELHAGGRTQALAESGTNHVTLHRIDVADVTVTRENGSTYVTRGTYELLYQGWLIAGPYPTNGGIDVLPGDYELIVRYTTALGPQANHYDLTF